MKSFAYLGKMKVAGAMVETMRGMDLVQVISNTASGFVLDEMFFLPFCLFARAGAWYRLYLRQLEAGKEQLRHYLHEETPRCICAECGCWLMCANFRIERATDHGHT